MDYTKEELEVLVNALISADPFKAKMEFIEQGRFLDILVNDKDEDVRAALAEKGYGLDILVNDSSVRVKRTVAEQGYGLDTLLNDESRLVRNTAQRKLQELAERGEQIASVNQSNYAPWKEQSLSKEECDLWVEQMVNNIRGIGTLMGSGYHNLKSFEKYGEKFNLYCEVVRCNNLDDEDFYGVFYALEFDEGDNLWHDWAHTEVLNVEELKNIIYDIASKDYTEDVQKHMNLDEKLDDAKNRATNENKEVAQKNDLEHSL